MIPIVHFVLFLLFVMKSGDCLRRMMGGKETIADTRFVAYIVMSPLSRPKLDVWLCGAAVVTPTKVLTAASCLLTVTHPYVIAGYRKYVNGRAVEYDECTKRNKRRVVTACVPAESKTPRLSEVDKAIGVQDYIEMDIGVATVDKDFGFDDRSWLDHCSWIPAPIRVSYNKRLGRAGVDVVLYGWGGTHIRRPEDVTDTNYPYLRELSGRLEDAKLCYREGSTMNHLKEKYLLCMGGDSGNLDGNGVMINRVGLTTRAAGSRRHGNTKESLAAVAADTVLRSKTNTIKRNGTEIAMCQGEHGAPLITWEGREKVVIGVGFSCYTRMLDSKSRIVDDYSCGPPSTFTSTCCLGLIVDCMIKTTPTARRSCELLSRKKRHSQIKEMQIDWSQADEE